MFKLIKNLFHLLQFNNLISKIKLPRRYFLKGLIVGELFALFSSSGCSKKSTEPEEEEPDDDQVEELKAIISGPFEVRLPSGNIGKTVDISSAGSTGNIVERTFLKKGPSDTDYNEVGTSHKYRDKILESGKHNYRLIVKDDQEKTDQADHELAALASDAPYNVPIAFFRLIGETPLTRKLALYLMDPEASSLVTKILETDALRDTSLSWEPNGKRLVIGIGINLYTFEIETGKIENILTFDGRSMNAVWSPKGDWIAYTEDGRHLTQGIDELALLNPETGEYRFLSGPVTWKEEYRVHPCDPAWNPDGDKIAAGGVIFYVEGKMKRRLGIFSDLWSENPKREPLHSEEYLKSIFGSSNMDSLDEGANGVAWSPDGELIAYQANWGVHPSNQDGIIIAKADGSGIVKIIDYGNFNISPKWSPGGGYIIFKGDVPSPPDNPGLSHIFRVDRNGENLVDLSASSADQNTLDSRATWYG